MSKTKHLGSISSLIKGYAPGQCVFVVLSDRKNTSTVLFVAIGKDPCDRLARQYRGGGAPAYFPTANVKPGYVSGDTEITLFEKKGTL